MYMYAQNTFTPSLRLCATQPYCSRIRPWCAGPAGQTKGPTFYPTLLQAAPKLSTSSVLVAKQLLAEVLEEARTSCVEENHFLIVLSVLRARGRSTNTMGAMDSGARVSRRHLQLNYQETQVEYLCAAHTFSISGVQSSRSHSKNAGPESDGAPPSTKQSKPPIQTNTQNVCTHLLLHHHVNGALVLSRTYMRHRRSLQTDQGRETNAVPLTRRRRYIHTAIYMRSNRMRPRTTDPARRVPPPPPPPP